ncbi:MAG: hypothetical protein L6V89_11470 [Oscillospiraceae bacterium]|nr:MAG: hypothetical protein L6V89_11470 [Oscillospiraceae bacterium]
MSERYKRLFALPENLHTEDAPVVIMAGALLKDNQTGRVLAQLKLKNVSEETIKSVKVSIQAFGKSGAEAKEIHYEYANISVKSGEEFGSKTPIEMNNKILYYSAVITEVLFENGTAWKTNINDSDKKALSERVRQALMNNSRTSLKKSAFIPLILAAAGILFSVSDITVYFGHNAKYLDDQWLLAVLSGSMTEYLISLIFPIAVFVLPKTNIMKTSRVMMYIGFALLGVQALAAILYYSAGLGTVLANLRIPGYDFLGNISNVLAWIRGGWGFDLRWLLQLMSSLCFLGKTVAGIIICKKAQV